MQTLKNRGHWIILMCLLPFMASAQLVDTTQVSLDDLGNYYQIRNGHLGVLLPKLDVLYDSNFSLRAPAPIQSMLYKDSTYSSTYENHLNAPSLPLNATTSIVLQNADTVSLRQSYTFLKPILLNGNGQAVDSAGPGYFSTDITLIKGAKSVMIENSADYEVYYFLNVSGNINPDQARYRGDRATSIANGYGPGGGIYNPGKDPYLNARVDLDYTFPRTFPYSARWAPWATDTGWFWQLYNTMAAQNANVVGYFDGPAHQLLGVDNSGVRVHTSTSVADDLTGIGDSTGSGHYAYTIHNELRYLHIDSIGQVLKDTLLGHGLYRPFLYQYGDTVHLLTIAANDPDSIRIRKFKIAPDYSIRLDTIRLDIAIIDPFVYGANRDGEQWIAIQGANDTISGLMLFRSHADSSDYSLRDVFTQAEGYQQSKRPDMRTDTSGRILLTFTFDDIFTNYSVLLPDTGHFILLDPYGMQPPMINAGTAILPGTGIFATASPNGSLTLSLLDTVDRVEFYTTNIGAPYANNVYELPNRGSIDLTPDSSVLYLHDDRFYFFDSNTKAWASRSGGLWDSITQASVYYNSVKSEFNILGVYETSLARFVSDGQSITLAQQYPYTSRSTACFETRFNRLNPDFRVFKDIRFAYGLFAGTAGEDLLALDTLQGIAREMHIRSGLSQKTQSYIDSSLQINSVYDSCAMYIPVSDLKTIYQKVITVDSIYNFFVDIDGTFKVVMDAWRDGSGAKTDSLYNQITNDIEDLIFALKFRDGIYDERYFYFEGAIKLKSWAQYIAGLLVDDKISNAQRDTLHAYTRLMSRVGWDDDFVPFFTEHGLTLGNPNMPLQYQNFRWFFALLSSQDPEYDQRADSIPTKVDELLRQSINDYGAAVGSPHYLQPAIEPTIFTLLQLKNAGEEDLFHTQDTLLERFSEFILHLLTPPSVRFSNNRKLVVFGDGSEESAPLFGLLGTGFADENPSLSKKLMHAYRYGPARSSLYGFPTISINHELPDTNALELGHAHFPGYLSHFRTAFNTPEETAVWFLNGDFYRDHRNDDPGAVSIYCLGAPLSLNYGSIFLPELGSPFRNKVIPYSIYPNWDQTGQGFILNEIAWSHTRNDEFAAFEGTGMSRGIFENSNSGWTRQINFQGGSDHSPIIALYDSFDDAQDYIWSMNFMCKDSVDTPSGKVGAPPRRFDPDNGFFDTPVPSDNFGLSAGWNKLSFEGQNWASHAAGGIDWKVYLYLSDTSTANVSNFTHTYSNAEESDEYEQTVGGDFEEKQIILRVRADSFIHALIIPYSKNENLPDSLISFRGDSLIYTLGTSEQIFFPKGYTYTSPDTNLLNHLGSAGDTVRLDTAWLTGGVAQLGEYGDTVRLRLHGNSGMRYFRLPFGQWSLINSDPTILFDSIRNSGSVNYVLTDSLVNSHEGGHTEYVFVKRNAQIKLKVLLYGPWVTAEGLMLDSLRSKRYLPLTEPYSSLGFPLQPGGETIAPGILDTIGPDAIVDWIYVELREDSLGPVLGSRAGLLQRDGDIRDTDGESALSFGSIRSDSVFVVIRHRNHAGVMLKEKIEITPISDTIYNFSDLSTPIYGQHAMRIDGGQKFMWPGNGDGNAIIKYQGAQSDILPIVIDVFGNPLNTNFDFNLPVFGYFRSDYNMNGFTKYQGAQSDILPIVLTVFGNPLNTTFDFNLPLIEQLPEN